MVSTQTTAQPITDGLLGTETLKKGVTSGAVQMLQGQLKTLGYYTGMEMGGFGNLTRQAVMDFQHKNGLSADGVVGSATRAKLYGAAVSVGTSGTQTALMGTAASTTTQAELGTASMQLYDQSETVRALQRKLTALGYYDGAITGHYGRKTKQAVMDFQKANDISRDGVAGGTTLQKLNAAAAPTPVPTAAPRCPRRMHSRQPHRPRRSSFHK